ncbi:GNAT family N-acetyltransferase [Photobacterium minamisatsumaniensis]|uniref:GNAT family N-acetyltransferase n=1 Tax=Photobacterium minamisatsumaniensis TaxID=2910233 RepID=UPI003D0B5AFC
MEFVPVNLQKHLGLCIEFRKDAHIVSHGDTVDFSLSDTKAWFDRLSTNSKAGFFHLVNDNQIIGQTEFISGLKDEYDQLYGYINLLYLTPEHRSQGLGNILQNFIFTRFQNHNCEYALLRYWPSNIQGKSFYRKHGWQDVGDIGERGQLALKKLV